MTEKQIYIMYQDGDKIGKIITTGKEVVEDEGFYKIYGMHNELIGAVKCEIVLVVSTTEKAQKNEM